MRLTLSLGVRGGWFPLIPDPSPARGEGRAAIRNNPHKKEAATAASFYFVMNGRQTSASCNAWR